MTFIGAIQTCFSKYFIFSGRAPRPEYWWFALFVILGALVADRVDAAIFPASAIPPASTLFQIGTFFPFLAVSWRRMHDTGRPGWLVFLPMIVSVAFIFLSTMGFLSGPNPTSSADPGNTRFVILGALQVVAAVFILWWLSQPTESEPNAYGSPPEALSRPKSA